VTESQVVIEVTRRWISTMVIGLNLCPFARRVFQEQKIRYAVSAARDETALRGDLARELQTLALAPISAVETTLLIHPFALADFLDYNEFLGEADRLVDALGLRGTIQIASFHPDYQFAGTDPDAAENYTNRSPYPMLHLLREASFSGIAASPDELLEVPRRNIAALRGLGTEKILAKLQSIWGE
jgi:hypothetical protein